ncbi:hypothetical protein GWI72_02150 [Microvirga tunisiensis]|uniref:Uncharacterized protein n=2 Tax=Pannonibacter tanglangensis TaxID=2750084 RepID=A0A7X5F222_9HYPH|nr:MULTISPECIES: hypothetical protein [unclassified Pannonibacter]NBN63427.1 hypothetical protein [Pannonibacter sp. XCT-34]NBN77064.1 hypothetical protein [Pannonibacter sp. XCT-53]
MKGPFSDHRDGVMPPADVPGFLPLTSLACFGAAGLYALFGSAATVEGAILLLVGVFLAMSSVTLALWQRLERGLGGAARVEAGYRPRQRKGS